MLSRSETWNNDKTIVQSTLLRELSFGLREGLSRHLSVAEVRTLRAKELKVKEKYLVDTAETQESAKSRQHLFLKQLFDDLKHHASNDSPVPVACVSHGGFIKVFLRSYCNHASDKIKNCAVSIITITWADEMNPESYQCRIDPKEVNLCPLTSDYIP
jgi:broad specificity phosphatase PhoE